MDKKVYEFISKQSGDPIIQWRTCAWTGEEFAIYQGDEDLLDKISPIIGGRKIPLPFPTLSPLARMRRRMMFRNERGLYNTTSVISGEKIVSAYCPDLEIQSMSSKEGRAFFDGNAYAQDYDPSRRFLSQYMQLFRSVPKSGIVNLNNENGEYDNFSGDNKNTYLNADIMNSENVSYSTTIKNVNNGYDLLQVHDSDRVYACNACSRLTNCSHLRGCKNCYNCGFSFLIVNCTNCWFCNAIQNKQNYIFNKPATKEEIDALRDSMKYYTKLKNMVDKFYKLVSDEFIKPSTRNVNCENSLGASLSNSKNSFWCYDSYDVQDCRYVMVGEMNRDCMDTTIFNPMSSQVYENISGGLSVTNSYSSFMTWQSSHIYFSDNCFACSYMIGCSGMKNASYCIFNKQYTKEEREKLALQILDKMINERVWGEFFPSQGSPFPYNDTVAMDRFPVHSVVGLDGKEEVLDAEGIGIVYLLNDEFIAQAELDLGGKQRLSIYRRTRNYEVNIPETLQRITAGELPENIDDVNDDILNKAIICEETGRPFKITMRELEFYRKMGVALPRVHPSVRHARMVKNRPDKNFSLRKCDMTGEEILSIYDVKAKHPVYSQKAFEKLLYG